MSPRLDQLRATLAAASATGRLVLTGDLLDSDYPAGLWRDLLGTDGLDLRDLTIPAGEPDERVTLRGTLVLLGLGPQAVTITLFESTDRYGRYEDAIECVVALDGPVGRWRLADWFQQPPPPWLDLAFPPDLALLDAHLVISSCDFGDPDGLVYSIPEPPTALDAALSTGLNFGARVEGYEQAFAPTRKLCGAFDERPAAGVIARPEDEDGLQLSLWYTANEDAAGGLAAFSASGVAVLAVTVEAIGCSGPIGPDARGACGVMLDAAVSLGGRRLELEIQISERRAALSGAFADGDALTLADIEHAFGLDALLDLLPSPFDHFGDIALPGFQAVIDLDRLALESLTFDLTTQHPWSLIDGVIAIQPYFSFRRADEGGGPRTTLSIGGEWMLGASRFVVELDPDSGDFSASMAVGEDLDIGAVFARFLPAVARPDCTLLDLDIHGNLGRGSLGLRIETDGGWGFDLGGTAISVEEIEITADYDGAHFSGHLAGTIVVADWRAHVDLVLDEECSFSIVLPELRVGEIAEAFLAFVGRPVELPDFDLQQLSLDISPASGAFSLSGNSTTRFEAFPGFEMQIVRFAVARAMEGGKGALDAELDLLFEIDGIGLLATAQYSHVEAHGAPGSEWLFRAAQGREPIRLGGLIRALEHMVGLDYPLDVGDLAVEELEIAFSLGGNDRHLSVSCKLASGSEDYAAFRLLAEKRAPAPGGEGGWTYLMSTQVGLERMDPARLPIAGPVIGQATGLRLEALRVTKASHAFAVEDGARFRAVTRGVDLRLPVKAGLDVSLLSSGLGSAPISLGIAGDGPLPTAPVAPAPAGMLAAAPPPPIDETSWFVINKGFGAFTLERLGLRFQSGRLTLLFDSHLSLQGLTLSLAGLGMGSPLDHFDPSFELAGLGLGFDAGPVSLSGGLLHGGPGLYAGSVRIAAENYALAAVGEYATSDPGRPELGDHTSMFVFGLLEAPLGGPPFCYVRGIAAGIGLNSQLRQPDAAEVGDFTLVQAAMPGSGFASLGLAEVLRAMDRDIRPRAGAEWLAAGLRFSSFELIQSVALITIPFDTPGNIALLGLSRLSMPPAAPDPIAMIEVSLRASVQPAAGLLAVQGQLTRNAFLLSHDCHPTGGFAFCAWFGGAHAGDFVVTLGGYHPKFPIPAHYPTVPRLAMQWRLSSALQIKGTSYFALVPNAVMAGGTLEAIWEGGPVLAWFRAGFDFLIYWKPFAYEITVSISVGARVTIDMWFTSVTISVHVGAELTLHGPPFGGEAWVDLDVVSFTIPFGASTPDRTPLTWAQFKASFLPPPLSLAPGAVLPWSGPGATNTICLARASGGLVRDLSRQKGYAGPLQWILNAQRLAIEVDCMIPVKGATFNGVALDAAPGQGWSAAAGVAPCAVAADAFTSDLTLVLTRLDPPAGATATVSGLGVTPLLRNIPAALWSCTASPEAAAHLLPPPRLGGDTLVENALVGLRIAPGRLDEHRTAEIAMEALQFAAQTPLPFDRGHRPAAAATASREAIGAALLRRGLASRPGPADRARRPTHAPQSWTLGAVPA